MEKKYPLETGPVLYGPSSVKKLYFDVKGKNFCFRMHWHERMEILRIFDGEMLVNLGNKTLTAKKDDIVIIPPRTPHMAETDSHTKYNAVMFDLRTFYNETEIGKIYLPAIYDGRLVLNNLTNNKAVLNALDSISRDIESAQEAFSVMADVYKFIFELSRNCVLEFNPERSSDKVVTEAIDYIETHFEEEITTNTLSKHFGYTIPYFCKKFKAHTGLSPMNYLKIFRIEKAYSMMKNKSFKISEIAQNCGFSDTNYFTRCFTAHFGHPPTYYKDCSSSKR